jgi:hypothetical protein
MNWCHADIGLFHRFEQKGRKQLSNNVCRLGSGSWVIVVLLELGYWFLGRPVDGLN